MNQLYNFRGTLFCPGHRCFAPWDRGGHVCFGAAQRRRGGNFGGIKRNTTRQPTSRVPRQSSPPCVASAALRQHGLLSRWQRAVSPPQPRQSRPERLASRTTWKKAHYTASRHPHFEAAPEGARRRTCKGEQQRFPREDRRLSAYQAAEAYRLTACSGRLWRSELSLIHI